MSFTPKPFPMPAGSPRNLSVLLAQLEKNRAALERLKRAQRECAATGADLVAVLARMREEEKQANTGYTGVLVTRSTP